MMHGQKNMMFTVKITDCLWMAFSNKETLFTSKLSKKLGNCYIMNTALYGAETPKSISAKLLKCGAREGWRSLGQLV
jgi:hypothetical protein